MAILRELISTSFIIDPIFQYVGELEKVFCRQLGLQKRNLDQGSSFPRTDYGPGEYDLIFVPMARDISRFRDNHQIIPIVFDVFPADFEQFCHDIAKFSLVYLTDLGACRQLTALGCNQVRLMPFSVSDADVAGDVPPKDIDIIQYGRRDPVFVAYMEQFLVLHPEIHYIWTECGQNNRYYFHSNLHGMIGSSDVRENFWHVLERCKISLVSVPDPVRRGGLETVAIRYFESAAKYCHMISRHPDKGEFAWFGVHEVTDRCDDFACFAALVRQFLAEPFSADKKARFRAFHDNHVTSKRARQLQDDLCAL